MLTLLAISNYRSLRNLVVPLKALNVITGANGSGISGLKEMDIPLWNWPGRELLKQIKRCHTV